jgi:hypothetical protein
VDINGSGSIGNLTIDTETARGEAVALTVVSSDREMVSSTSNYNAATLSIELKTVPLEVVKVSLTRGNGNSEGRVLNGTSAVELSGNSNIEANIASGLGSVGSRVSTIVVVLDVHLNVALRVVENCRDIGTTARENVSSNILGDDSETNLSTGSRR